jgi:dienelactone hydrolase
MRKSRIRRMLMGGAVAGGLAPALAIPAAAVSAVSPATVARQKSLARLSLPAPGGPHPIGTVALHLVDRSRHDPWVASQRYRELMVSVLYPARDTARYPVAPQMTPGAAKHFDASLSTPVHQGWGIPPGVGDPRTLGNTLTEELASRGYVVVTIDHTYDASEVEFPEGRVEPFGLPMDGDIIALMKKVTSTRVTDTRFVLDQLGSLSPAHDPDADGRRLPYGLGTALDLRRIGMFGQSAGGFAALQTMHEDPRVAAAADLDGTVGYDQDDGGPGLSPLAEDGLKRPFLLMGSQASDHHVVRSWEALWDDSHGWRRDLHLRGAKHHSYTDLQSLLPQIQKQAGLPEQAVYGDIGWVEPGHAVAAQRAYLTAFFDRWLRGRDSALLAWPQPLIPRGRAPLPPARAAEGATPPQNLSGHRTARTRRPLESGATLPPKVQASRGEALRRR